MANNNSKQSAAVEKITEAMQGPGAHLGDVVWQSLTGVNITRSELVDRLRAQGLPDSLAPESPTAQASFGAAVSGFREGTQNFFLRRAERGKKGGDVLIARQMPNAGTTPKLVVCAKVKVRDDFSLVVEQEAEWTEDAQGVIDALRTGTKRHLDYVSTTELSSMVVSTILGWCGGIRLRDRGNIYWCHASGGPEIRALSAVIDGIGSSYISVMPVHDTEVFVCEKHGSEVSPTPGACGMCGKPLVATKEARHAVARAATESFESELSAVFEELEAFKQEDATVRPSTLERRLEDFEDLRNRVDLYADILDNQKGKLEARLDDAAKQVRAMLVSVS